MRADRSQGESYPEGRPSTIEYQCDIPVSGNGFEPQTEIEIFCNDETTPPKHIDRTTRYIATLSLNLSKISNSVKQSARVTRMGYHRYYSMEGVIEATYESARITYAVKLGGKTLERINLGSGLPIDLSTGVTHDMVTVRYED